MSRLVSGIKPTGDIHIGNYFGVMQPLLAMQESFESFVFIADLHALNQINDAALLRSLIREIATAYLAVGLNPEKVTLFRQSEIPAHAELCLIFNSITSMGLLERAHAYKDAVAKDRPVNMGLFDYPVLMAADILLYNPDVVPVGEDQQQHIEIMSDIAGRFNHLYGQTFAIPKGKIHENTGVVLGLDGRKMSKSYANVLGLFDAPDVTKKKVMGIVTDSAGVTDPKNPETCTVFAFHRLFSQSQLPALDKRYREGSISYRESKEILLANVLAFLEPIQAKKRELDAQPEVVDQILAAGRTRAEEVAVETLRKVKERVGL